MLSTEEVVKVLSVECVALVHDRGDVVVPIATLKTDGTHESKCFQIRNRNYLFYIVVSKSGFLL